MKQSKIQYCSNYFKNIKNIKKDIEGNQINNFPKYKWIWIFKNNESEFLLVLLHQTSNPQLNKTSNRFIII